ncbi:hypothetical protein [Vogesella indigofera]|uniref:hypothetical protein n=1 Tax=Vogesella indigofera TaxID=45465 RepID=UPI003F431D7F
MNVNVMIAPINTKYDVIAILNGNGNMPIKYLVYEIFRQPRINFPDNKSTVWQCAATIADHDFFIPAINHDFSNLSNLDWNVLIHKLQSFTICNFNIFLDKKSIRQQLFIENNFKKYKRLKDIYFHKSYSKKISWVDHLAIYVHINQFTISQQDIETVHLLSETFNQIKSTDSIFNWFNIKDKESKIATAHNWLKRHELDLTKGINIINDVEIIKAVFDRLENNIEKKQLILQKIKKSHSNQKSIKKQIENNKKRNQTNLNIRERYHNLIKQVSETTGEPPARVVEHALDLYLSTFQASISNNSATLTPPTTAGATQTALSSQNPMQHPQQTNITMPLLPPAIPQVPLAFENGKQTESFIDIFRKNTIRNG